MVIEGEEIEKEELKTEEPKVEIQEVNIEGYEQDKYSEELTAILNKEIDYIESVYNQKVEEIKAVEITMGKLRTVIRELKSILDKKKLAKSVLLNEKIIRPPKVIIKPKEEINYTDWKQKKKELKKKKKGDLVLDFENVKNKDSKLNIKEISYDDWKSESKLNEKEVE